MLTDTAVQIRQTDYLMDWVDN